MTVDTSLAALVSLFNAGKADLPDGALRRNCIFRLNGRAYHEHLGRPPGDPLVRLIGCGPAGYRFIQTALRYAMERPRLDLHGTHRSEGPGGESAGLLMRRASLSGTLRGSETPFTAECELTLLGDGSGAIREIAVTMGDPDVERIMQARQR